MIRPVARSAADGLALAAAPTFAAMALAAAWAGGPLERLCAPLTGFHLGGMSQMYWLMSAFHLGPWLGLWARFERSSQG